MDHAAQVRRGPDDRGERRVIGHIRRDDVGGHPEFGEFGCQFDGSAATGEQDQAIGLTGRGQVPGDQSAQGSRGTGDQHGPLGRRDREGQHDLADVPGLAQVTEGVRGPAHVPGRHRQRLQRPRGEQRAQGGEHPADRRRIQLQQVERLVLQTPVIAGHVHGVADVGLAHLDEPVVRAGRQPQRGIHEVTGQGVQDNVHAPVQGPEGRLEVEGAGRGDPLLLQAEAPEHRPLRRAGGAEHRGAELLGQLHRGDPDAAGRGVDQDRLPHLQPGQLDERVIGGEEDHRSGGGLGQGPALRHRGQEPLVGDHLRGEGRGEEAHDEVAGLQSGHVRGGLQHHPGPLQAQLSGLARVHSEHVQHVAEVHPAGLQLHPNLAGGKLFHS